MSRHPLVIFDLDGTLIDSSEGIVHAVLETIEELDYEPLSEEFIESCIGPPIGDSIGSRVGYTPEQIKRFYEVFRPLYKTKYLMECTVYPGITELLKALRTRGIKTAIATNKREDYTKTLLDNLGLSENLDYIEAMDMEGKLKKADLIGNCISASGCSVKDAVMVGDADSDLNAAKACGVDFIGVRYGFGFRTLENPSFDMAETVEELSRMLL